MRGYSNPGCQPRLTVHMPDLGYGVDSMRDICLRNTEFYWPIKNSDRAARVMGKQCIDDVLSPGQSRNEVVERIHINLSSSSLFEVLSFARH